MARRTARAEMGEALALDEAAALKEKAAGRLAKADALLHGEEDVSHEPSPEDFPQGSFSDSPPPAEPTKIDRVLANIGGEGKFEVYKHDGAVRAKVGIYPIEEWPDMMESIARTHNGGTFTVVFKDRGGRIQGQDTQTYDSRAYSSKDAPAASPKESGLEKVIELMMAQQRDSREELSLARAENSKLMLALIERGNARTPASEMADMVKAVKDIIGPGASDPMKGLKDTVEMLAMLKEESPLGEPASPIMTAVDKALGILGPIFSAWAKKLEVPQGASRLQAGATPAALRLGHTPVLPPRPAPGASALGGAQAGPTAPLGGPTMALGAVPVPAPAPDPRMSVYAEQLLSSVLLGARAEAVAGFICDSILDADLDGLEEMANDPGLISGLIAAEPKLGQHQGWLIVMARNLKERIEARYEVDDGSEEILPDGPSPEPIAEVVPAPSGNGSQPEKKEVQP